ncbi:MAG: hypothetical protein KGZ25_09615, partial [Planctomycetes bacterium]|nr:hypothetical protein [Planctomycetota bacterium]
MRHDSKKRRWVFSRFLKEARRFYHLTQFRDALNRIGTLLYRGSLKYTLITSIATGLGHQLPKVGLPGLNNALVVLLPALVFVVAFGGGLCLRYIPSLISLGRITTAEAADFNLMKDYRKAEMDEHLTALWERIFRYEAEIRYGPEEIQAERQTHCSRIPRIKAAIREFDEEVLAYLGVRSDAGTDDRREAVADLVESLLCARPQCAFLEKTKRAFVTSARHAVREHLEQEEQTRRIGFDISQWEDWRDSAYFHPHDRHLQQQFNGNPALQAVKREVRWDRWSYIREVPVRIWQKIWFRLITRAISVHLGAAISELNEEYPVEELGLRFRAQIIMWPGAEEQASWLEDLPGRDLKRNVFWRLAAFFLLRDPDLPPPAARIWDKIGATFHTLGQEGFENPKKEVVAIRQHMIRSRFGRTFRDANEVINRVYLGTFQSATKLRIAYDAEYAAGMLEQTPDDDYEAAGVPVKKWHGITRDTREVRSELESFLTEAAKEAPRLDDELETRRAVAVAFHTN